MSPEPETPAAPMSEPARLANVLLEPKKAFADIAQRPRPWAPLLLVIVAAIVFVACFTQRVGWERFMRQQLETNRRTQQLTPEQRERALAMQMKIAPVMGYVGPAVSVPVMALVIAGVLLLTGKMVGSGANFKQMFGITAYSFVPGVINSAAGIAVMFLKNPDEFNLQNPTAFNAGAFLDPETTSKAVMSVAGSIDLFTIWSMILMAIGISAASRRVTAGKALPAVVIPWLLWIAVKAAWAGIMG
ncbi:MAG: Yip1 family protein [Bryobacteraceae bacterium]